MSHAAVNGRMKKPDYKEYVSFLETYKSGRKEDQTSICSSDSGISMQSPSSVVSRDSSSTSLNSDASDISKCTPYNSYLENYKTKKFGSVKLPSQNFNSQSGLQERHQDHKSGDEQETAPKRIVKSEVFIQIVNPESNVAQISKTFVIPGSAGKSTLSRQNSVSDGIKNRVNTFESKQNSDEAAVFSAVKRSNSFGRNITNKQRQCSTSTLPRKMTGKPSVAQKVNLDISEAKKDSDCTDSSFLLKRNNSLNSSRSKKHFASIHKMLNETVVPQQVEQRFDEGVSKTEIVKSETERNPSVCKPPGLPPFPSKTTTTRQISDDLKVSRPNGTPPIPPPLPQVVNNAITITSKNNAREIKVILPVQSAVTSPKSIITSNQEREQYSSSSISATSSTGNSSPAANFAPPPPPPPPLPNMSQHSSSTNATRTSCNAPSTRWSESSKGKPVPFSSSTLPRQGVPDQGNQKVSVKTNGANLSEAAKAELIKKQAYSMLRGMYGAYHDQANGYVSTLPSYMVKKDNGLKDIISNIEAQGGLEKLNGRVNPKLEAE